MTIFSELYGVYFRIAAAVLERESVTAEEVRTLVQTEGFRDSVLFLPQRLIPQKDGSDWGLLRSVGEGCFASVLSRKPAKIVTQLQKRWLKAKLADPKLRLFLSDETFEALSQRLRDVTPLYLTSHFRCTDRYADGDLYTDPEYRRRFRQILEAVKSRELLDIEFNSGHSNRIRRRFLPLRLEFSTKNDKFRVYCRTLRNGSLHGSTIINLGRIVSVRSTGKHWGGEVWLDDYFQRRRCKEPVTVYVSDERNSVERFLMEFSSYEKQTERDLENGGCRVKLWYDGADETELLIRLLSFGPVLEILSPPDFRAQAAERVRRQYDLLS